MRVFLVLAAALCVAHVAAINNVPSSGFDVQRAIPGAGSQGITFTPNGDLYTSSGSTICHFANAANLARGSTIAVSSGRCGPSNTFHTNIVSSQAGKLYNVNGYEINPITFQATRKWNDCGASHGIAIDPRDGAVFVGSVSSGRIYRIPNPDQHVGEMTVDCRTALFFDGGAAGVGGFDGITVGPDGKLYAAGWTLHKFVIISAWSESTPFGSLIVAKNAINVKPDGISICVNNGVNFALVATTGGSISRYNLSGPGGDPVYAESTIATDVGGYLDFSAVDPKGCIWGSILGSSGIYRVMNADGSCSCASAQVPTSECSADADCPQTGVSECSRKVCNAGKCELVAQPSGTPCRASAGACDQAESCDGSSLSCPADSFAAAGTECRESAGPCDQAEVCSGSSAACPSDSFKASGAECRASAGPCDAAEVCSGSSASCPSDSFKAPGTECRAAAGLCDQAEVCSGSSAACPTDAFKPAGADCRPARDGCDVAEKCSGSSISCPSDLRNDHGYSFKCATTCFLCGLGLRNQVVVSSGGETTLIGGCNLGKCRSYEILPWPECVNQNIRTTCPNNRGLSNAEFFRCNPSNGTFTCTNKFDGGAVSNGFNAPFDQYW